MESERIFFSYSRVDHEFAFKLASELRESGINVWIDQLDIRPGVHWDLEIENALKTSKCFLVILTPQAISSSNVLDEISYALEHGKKVIPVLLMQCNIPFRLKRLQYIDFTKNFQDGLNRLVIALNEPIENKNNIMDPAELTTAEKEMNFQQSNRDFLRDGSAKNFSKYYHNIELSTKIGWFTAVAYLLSVIFIIMSNGYVNINEFTLVIFIGLILSFTYALIIVINCMKIQKPFWSIISISTKRLIITIIVLYVLTAFIRDNFKDILRFIG